VFISNAGVHVVLGAISGISVLNIVISLNGAISFFDNFLAGFNVI